MGERTNIEWTDHTFNPWLGCSKVHAGCTHCYAEALMDNRYGKVQWGPSGTRVVTSPANWRKPLTWNRKAKADRENYERAASWSRSEYDIPDPYERPRVFCASLADVFEDWQGEVCDGSGEAVFLCDACGKTGRDGRECPHCGKQSTTRHATLDDLRRELFSLIDATPHLDWLLLTKRPENVRRMWPEVSPEEWMRRYNTPLKGTHCRPNVWLGTSVSDQETADDMVPRLLECRGLASVQFLSIEPLLGPIHLTKHLLCQDCITDRGATYDRVPEPCDGRCPRIEWVIAGGESGPQARPCRVEWIESIRDQCRDASVPVFVKQLGSLAVVNDEETGGLDVALDLRDSKGGNHYEWPADLRVREFPEVATVGAGD